MRKHLNKYRLMRVFIFFCLALLSYSQLYAAVYQWSVPVTSVMSTETNGHPTAFLWIPENCRQVRAVIVGQHNMSEEDLFDRRKFRSEMAKLSVAIVWITPAVDIIFDFHNGAGDIFEGVLSDLAELSGYGELAFAPVIPIGHSAAASYPWNFGAWNPERTLAMLSLHGDAPLTNLTGSGRPNPNWEGRTIEGVPGLMIEGEYEWWEDRVQPALDYKMKHPQAPVSFLCDAGHGHFDVSDELVDYICLFIKKAIQYRLPKDVPLDRPVKLKTVNPEYGWLKERWRKDEIPVAKAAPYHQYQGDKKDAFWYFDKEIAESTEAYYARVRGKKSQYLGLSANGALLPFNQNLHARIIGKFTPEADGLTFYVKPDFTDTLRSVLSISHAKGKPCISRICGPVEKVNDTTFAVLFYRMGFDNPKRTGDIWLLASHDGDDEYKSSVQQLNIRIPYQNNDGTEQHICFYSLPDVITQTKEMQLKASADSGMPVCFYVREGPAEVKDGRLIFSKIPPGSKFPIKVTVVAWQYGRSSEPKIQSAEPVTRSLLIKKNE